MGQPAQVRTLQHALSLRIIYDTCMGNCLGKKPDCKIKTTNEDQDRLSKLRHSIEKMYESIDSIKAEHGKMENIIKENAELKKIIESYGLTLAGEGV